MKIIELELKGYRRLHLAQIHHVIYKPVEKLQLILGTNGSGKSSLLKELSPLPPVPADYTKDGYKRIVIEHRGKLYELSSQFGQSQPHSFLINGVEENPGGTITVQKELVKREFNITQEVQDLMLSLSLFTRMGPGERRSWFTRLDSTNYNYAIGVFQRLKERLRDIQGGIKLNQTRAVQEANKLLSEDQEKQLSDEISKYREFIDHLLTQKSTPKQFGYELRKQADDNVSEMKRLSNQIIKLRGDFLNLEGFLSIEEIAEAATKVQIEISRLEYIIGITSKEIEEHQKVVGALKDVQVSNLKDVDIKMDAIHKELEKYRELIQQVQKFEDPELAHQQLNGIFENMSILLTEMPINAERQYSSENFQKLLERSQSLHQAKLVLENTQNQLLAIKKYQEDRKESETTECPKCYFTWKQGYDENKYQTVLKRLSELEEAFKKNEEETKSVTALIEETKEYFALYRSYQSIVGTSKALQPFWNEIVEQNIIFNEPRSIIYRLDRLRHLFVENLQVERLKTELDGLVKLKALTEKAETEQFEKIQLKLNELDEQLFQQNKSLREKSTRVQQLKSYQKTAIELLNCETQLSNVVTSQEEISKDLVEDLRQSLINGLIRDAQLELTRKEQQLSQVNVQKALVDSIQKQLKELEEESRVIKIMVDELSPTTGLIARGLLSFIQSFVQQMNSFIRKVWLYPLEIIPILPDEDDGIDLDYKFSVLINHRTEIPDIKQASSAMAEIINLAFVIVSLKYLGLSDGILCLDEFARTFDSVHRESAFKTITNLIAQSDFSQIFIVSHFENSYGSIKNAEIAVLCSKNIVIPKDSVVNNHIHIN